jgi:hypothetical protein
MVDGYLNEEWNPIKDIGRVVLRSGFNLQAFKGYREVLRSLILECDAVVVASPEQREVIETMNSNVHVILDCHSEIPFLLTKEYVKEEKRSKIFWEGQSSNLKHLAPVANIILSAFTELELTAITNRIHYRVADRFGRTPSNLHLKKKISREFQSRVDVVDWSVSNLVEVSRISKFGLIPINRGDPFAQAKPENKLLIMWRLGLPTLVSSTQAYDRVLNDLELSGYSVKNWNNEDLSKESISDILARWSTDKRTVLDYLNETHSCSRLNQKWDQVIDSVG